MLDGLLAWLLLEIGETVERYGKPVRHWTVMLDVV